MKYELMIIGNTEGNFSTSLSKVEKTIKESKGEKVSIDKLGRKALSYPIAKQTQGEYVVINFEGEAATIKSTIDLLRLERDNILRYLLTKPKKGKVNKVKPEEIPKAKTKVTVKTVVAKPKAKKEEKPKAKTKKTTVKKATKKTKK